jgi:hypothetical protein
MCVNLIYSHGLGIYCDWVWFSLVYEDDGRDYGIIPKYKTSSGN